MIVSLDLKCFRKHEDLHVDFRGGLNVIRGPNEIGKTTLAEAILYALYGAKAIRDTLTETVTWGRKESELKVVLVIRIDGKDLTFSRSKSGAECNWAGGKVTGQGEVTKYAAEVLGADEKTASMLMLASQDGMRGALENGPTKVSELMGRLADFDLIDRILNNANQKLMLGTDAPVREKLIRAEGEVADLVASTPDPAALLGIAQAIVDTEVEITAQEKVSVEHLQPAMMQADQAVKDGKERNAARSRSAAALVALESELLAEQRKLEAANAAAGLRPPAERIAALRLQLADAQGHAKKVAAYSQFLALRASYPTVAWDSDKTSFDAELARVQAALAERKDRAREIGAAVQALGATRIAEGKCPTCGQDVNSGDHTKKHNAAIAEKIQVLFDELNGETVHGAITALNDDLQALQSVATAAVPLLQGAQRLGDLITADESVFPPVLSWVGEPPAAGAAPAALQAELQTLESQENTALQALGKVSAHQAAIVSLEARIVSAREVVESLPEIDVEPLTLAYEQSYANYTQHADLVRQLKANLIDLRHQETTLKTAAAQHGQKLATAQARVTEYRRDIETLAFNNQLVKKLKAMKPMITDHLWNTVLSAVSNFFSTLRGEQSVVTKDADGFKVNGQSVDSLSGSTLDVLALSIRVALTKTFIPHASFMILDEPAHGCDPQRTGNVLGFLSAVGFDQTILASHDELSEAVADHVITLGA